MPKAKLARLREILDSHLVHTIIFSFLILDLVLTFTETLVDFLPSETRHHPAVIHFERAAWVTAIVIISSFALEIILRIIAFGFRWLKTPLHIFDVFVVFGSLAILSYFNAFNSYNSTKAAGLLVLARAWRVVRVVESSVSVASKKLEAKIHDLEFQNAALRSEMKHMKYLSDSSNNLSIYGTISSNEGA